MNEYRHTALMDSTRRAWRVSLFALLFAGILAGCSDDSDEKPSNNQPQQDAGTTDTADTADVTDPNAFHIEGLSAPVKVQFDPQGVLHIDCKTDLDCYIAQGYFHADARFFEMDLIRRQTRGEISELLGGAGISSDTKFRRLNTTADGTPLEEAYLEAVSAETRAMLDAYASGVNAWLGDMRAEKNGATLSEDYAEPLIEGAEIRDWEPEDTVALYLQLGYQLGETATDDLFRGEMAARLSPEVAADLFSVKPGLESNTLQASGATAPNLAKTHIPSRYDLQAMRKIHKRLLPAASAMSRARAHLMEDPSFVFGVKDGQDGSNNWVVAPERTENGHAFLANDPHLSLNSPAIWYFVELDSKTNGDGDLHVVGASIPAVPGVIIGHNDHISWGVTTAKIDLADAYIEELNEEGTAVIFNGEEVPIVEKEFTFNFKGGGGETVTFEYVPHHGPIIEKDVANKTAVSIRWVLQEPGNDLDFIRELMGAKTTQQAMDSLGPVRAINQNWIFMDREGNIGWNPKAAIPNRSPWVDSETPNWLPLPGDGSAEWDGYLPADQSPKMYNPPAGFIATANNDMDGSYTDGDATNDGHSPWQAPPALGHRHKRIVDMIAEGGNAHTMESMLEIQADTYILHGELLVPHLLAVADAHAGTLSEGAQQVVDALSAWEYTCPTGLDGSAPREAAKSSDPTLARESIGCAAFHVMLPYLTRAVFGDEVNENPPPGESKNYDVLANWLNMQAPLIYVFDAPGELHNGTDYFDDIRTEDVVETRDDIVLDQLDKTAAKLDELLARVLRIDADEVTPDDWRWGRIHTVTFVSLVSIGDFHLTEVGPFANDGGFYSVDVANPTGRNGNFRDTYHHTNGASLRVVFEAGPDGIEGNFQLPGGQDHHRDSEFFNSLIDDWLENIPNKLLYTRDEVDAAAVKTVNLVPAP